MKKAFVPAVILLTMFFIFAAQVSVQTQDDRNILIKRHGDHWVKVNKGPKGIKILGEIPKDEIQTMIKRTQGYRSIQQGADAWFEPVQNIETGSWPESVAIGDLNNDGRNDVAMCTSFYFDPDNDYKLFVFIQNNQGKLNTPVKYDTTADYSSGGDAVDIGDVNGDTLNDVAITGKNGINVFIQNTSGTLNPYIAYNCLNNNTPFQLWIADMNGDGKKDVCVVTYANEIQVFIQKSDGTLDTPVSYPVSVGGFADFKVGDLNNDSRNDVAVSNYWNGSQYMVGVLLQTATGTFATPVYYASSENLVFPDAIAIGIVNNDNLNDLIWSAQTDPDREYILTVLPQNTGGTLGPPYTVPSGSPDALLFGDVNRDTMKDVLSGEHGGSLGVQLRKNDGTLEAQEVYDGLYATHLNRQGIAFGDINFDGKNDVVQANYNFGLVFWYGKENKTEPGPGPVVIPKEPVAVVENSPYIFVPQNALLSGLLSFAPNAAIIAYNWELTQKPAGSAAVLSSTTAPEVFLNMDREGIYMGTLTVQDNLLRFSKPRLFLIEGILRGFPPSISIFAQRKELHAKIIQKEYVELQVKVTEAFQAPAPMSQFLLQKAVEGGGFTLIEDFKGKAVYDPWSKTYSYQCKDRDVQKQKKYTYQVSVVDDKGNVIATAVQTI